MTKSFSTRSSISLGLITSLFSPPHPYATFPPTISVPCHILKQGLTSEQSHKQSKDVKLVLWALSR
jgi:hypothetical protein